MKQYFAFQWHITDDCDQRCKHCYIFAENTCKQLDSMTWEQMQDVVANCEDFCEMYGRLPYFYITGGDPILHPDFWPLLELLAIKKIPFTLMGNPFHLTDEVCQRMKMLGCEKYQLSIDGLEQTHDWFRKPGSYQTTLEKIDTINQAGIRSVVMTTVSGTNIGEVPGIIDAVVEAGADVFAFARYCPTSEEKDTGMTPLEYRHLLEVCDAKFKAYEAAGCGTYFNRKDHLWTLYQYETGEFTIPEKAESTRRSVGLRNGAVPGIRQIYKVCKMRAERLVPGLSRRGQRCDWGLLRPRSPMLENEERSYWRISVRFMKGSICMKIALNTENFVPVHTKACFLPDRIVEIRKVDKEQPDENTYLKTKNLAFHNGVIEVDVCGKLLPDAPDYARGFIGIVFRANENDSEFESFYIRPTNGKDCDDPVRKAHGCQYFSYPG